MSNERLAQQYAQVVFETALAKWLTPLKSVATALEQSGAVSQLDDPALVFNKKQELVRTLLPANTPSEVQNLLLELANKNHMHLLSQIVGDLNRFAQRDTVGGTAKVTSAVPLTDGEKSALETKIRAQFGKDLQFDYLTDRAILGGVIIRVGDKVIDGSVAGKLAALEEKLK